MPEVYLGLGSNLGNREENLFRALIELVKIGPLERSSWYETEPVDMLPAPKFLNGVVRMWTDLSALMLLRATREIEEKLGRNPPSKAVEKKLPRMIDIDILFYGDAVINLPDLVVPHPRLPERAFVLVPLCELAPEKRHPVLGLTVQEMLARVSQKGVKKWNGA
ncbi:MAG: 2-amino-4-hydroxy-6-hydroxymethyldihydropteridine diphosphokinase [candidate division WOR-3 bacterium]